MSYSAIVAKNKLKVADAEGLCNFLNTYQEYLAEKIRDFLGLKSCTLENGIDGMKIHFDLCFDYHINKWHAVAPYFSGYVEYIGEGKPFRDVFVNGNLETVLPTVLWPEDDDPADYVDIVDYNLRADEDELLNFLNAIYQDMEQTNLAAALTRYFGFPFCDTDDDSLFIASDRILFVGRKWDAIAPYLHGVIKCRDKDGNILYEVFAENVRKVCSEKEVAQNALDTCEAYSADADEILKGIIENICVDAGLAKSILELYLASRDKKTAAEMFRLLTGLEFDEFVIPCMLASVKE